MIRLELEMKKAISHEDISSLCLKLSLLLHAGVGVGDALTLLLEESDASYQELLSGMAQQVDDGASLSAAMKQTESFPAYVSGLVEIGRASCRERVFCWV